MEGKAPEMKKPRSGQASGLFGNNVKTTKESNVMSKNSTAAAQIIPFDFGKKPVRAMLIDDQPWFVADDVADALQYSEASAMTRHLDEDEKGLSIVQTLGGDQKMLVINESGLYSAILRSRKAEAKRFKKWVTAEVLPAIRKHGRYEDASGKMGTLLDGAIGVTELTALNGVIRQKAAIVRKDRQRSFIHTMHSRLHTRFNVPRTELILAKDFEAACNFVAAYAIDGEWIGKDPESGHLLTDMQLYDVWFVVHHFERLYEIFKRSNLHVHLGGLGSTVGSEMIGHFLDGYTGVIKLKKLAPEFDAAQRRLKLNRYSENRGVAA